MILVLPAAIIFLIVAAMASQKIFQNRDANLKSSKKHEKIIGF
jgi:hypothetical protein